MSGTRISDEAWRASFQVAVDASATASLACVPTWLTDFRNDLPKIDVPTLVVQGTEDRILPIDATARRLPALIKDAQLTEIGGEIIVQGARVSMGSEAWVTQAGAYRFFAGWRSDPFFFDALGAVNNFQFTGEDTFADKNVCSIALELPNSALGGGARVHLWHRSLVQAEGAGSAWVQADRGARPHQTPFLASADRDAYLSAEPAQDERFVAMFAHALEHTGGYTPEEARTVAATLWSALVTRRALEGRRGSPRYPRGGPGCLPGGGRAA